MFSRSRLEPGSHSDLHPPLVFFTWVTGRSTTCCNHDFGLNDVANVVALGFIGIFALGSLVDSRHGLRIASWVLTW